MKAILLAAGLVLACQAMAGEDSTDHWGAGGTGPAWYQTPCGLADFPGPVDDPDRQRCGQRAARRVVEKQPDRAADPSAASKRAIVVPAKAGTPLSKTEQ